MLAMKLLSLGGDFPEALPEIASRDPFALLHLICPERGRAIIDKAGGSSGILSFPSETVMSI
jgi:hypothetical protein